MNSRILPAIAILIAIGMFFAYVSPTWSGSIAETKALIANDDRALAAADRFAQHQNELIAQRDAIDPASLKKLGVFLPDSVDNVGLILDLNALAAKSGISLSNVDATTNLEPASGQSDVAGGTIATGHPALNSVDLSLSAIGTYASLKNFLNGIERSARLLDLRELTIKGSDSGVYTYQMKLRIHWLR